MLTFALRHSYWLWSDSTLSPLPWIWGTVFLANCSSNAVLILTLKMNAAHFSETSVSVYESTWCHNLRQQSEKFLRCETPRILQFAIVFYIRRRYCFCTATSANEIHVRSTSSRWNCQQHSLCHQLWPFILFIGPSWSLYFWNIECYDWLASSWSWDSSTYSFT
jgi:hypothetical protein